MPAISALVLGDEEQFADLSDSHSESEEDEMMEGEELIDFDLEARKYLVNPDDDYDDYYDDDMQDVKAVVRASDLKMAGAPGSKVEKSITGAGNVTMKAMQQKYEHKINLDSPKTGDKHSSIKDKSDRATTENVMDQRTRNVIFKFMRNEIMTEIHGSISTGKEANVYLCATKDPEVYLALKIYKTSILVFKDRSSYTAGEFRFRRGYKGKNPRKMVTAWAEKEVRNLNRLHQTGKIQCPVPIKQANNCLLMSFIGVGDNHAPRLRDAGDLSLKTWNRLYLSTMKDTRVMFQECKLVHADLSEYNILYHNNDVVIIDVSQSVEHDHPNALTFLRKDCWNVNSFFKSKGVLVCSCRQYTDFTTVLGLADEDVDQYLTNLMDSVADHGQLNDQEKLDDAVFRDSHIPRRLDQIKMTDAERDLISATLGQTSEILYANVNGLDASLKPQGKLEVLDEEEENSEESENGDDSENEDFVHHKDPSRQVEPIDKKAHKKAIKEANRERRKEKMPKHEKKRKEKKGKVKK